MSSVLILAGLTPQNLSSCKLLAPISVVYKATISDPFRQPICDRCAGNRGIEYTTQPGTPISAGASGVVSFSGVVANKKYLVIRTAAGRRLTYGSILNSDLHIGNSVVVGQIIGTTSNMLYFGVRESSALGDIYVDPAKFLNQNNQISSRAVLVSGAGTSFDLVGPGDRDSAC
ncbi:MAG: peptidoglycan DD-metalloendopeptidase family protein [Actinobacteria bacterium]|nr:peptidoglycan DD-metalloendopeptidase family protein [Actinomycetota bacterium]